MADDADTNFPADPDLHGQDVAAPGTNPGLPVHAPITRSNAIVFNDFGGYSRVYDRCARLHCR